MWRTGSRFWREEEERQGELDRGGGVGIGGG